MSTNTIIVSRETYKDKKSGQEYFSYFIEGEVKGKPVRVNIVPHDIGGTHSKIHIFLLYNKI